jgi:hypothetical protein
VALAEIPAHSCPVGSSRVSQSATPIAASVKARCTRRGGPLDDRLEALFSCQGAAGMRRHRGAIVVSSSRSRSTSRVDPVGIADPDRAGHRPESYAELETQRSVAATNFSRGAILGAEEEIPMRAIDPLMGTAFSPILSSATSNPGVWVGT